MTENNGVEWVGIGGRERETEVQQDRGYPKSGRGVRAAFGVGR